MQNCKVCGASWDVNKELNSCPFCGANLSDKKIANIEEAFQFIIARHGNEILKSTQILGLLSDYAPELLKERKLIKVAIESGAYSAIYQASLISDKEMKGAANKYVTILNDSFFIDEVWAKKAIDWVVNVLSGANGSDEQMPDADTESHKSIVAEIPKEVDEDESNTRNIVLNPVDKRSVYLLYEGNNDLNTFGKKGVGLCCMTQYGMPVPQGFIISARECCRYYEEGKQLRNHLLDQIKKAMIQLQEITGKTFGDGNNPLLLAVRSSCSVDMPGQMKAVLNVGLNEDVVCRLANTVNELWAWKSYCQFIVMFSINVMEISPKYCREVIEKASDGRILAYFSAQDYQKLAVKLKSKYKELIGEEFPKEPYQQLFEVIRASYREWNHPVATVYRKNNNIPNETGIAICVQMMVYGNMYKESGVGQINTANGDSMFYEDVLCEDTLLGLNVLGTRKRLVYISAGAQEYFDAMKNALRQMNGEEASLQCVVENGRLYFVNICSDGK